MVGGEKALHLDSSGGGLGSKGPEAGVWRLQLRPSYNQAEGARRAPAPSPSPCPRRFQDPVGGEGHPGRPKDRPGSQRATGGL